MVDTLQFFAAKTLLELLENNKWKEEADNLGYAIIAFEDHILYANSVFLKHFVKAKNFTEKNIKMSEIIPKEFYWQLEKVWEVEPFNKNNFNPVFIFLESDKSEEIGVLCAHTFIYNEKKAALAVWINKAFLPTIAIEETSVLNNSDTAFYHIVQNIRSKKNNVQYISPSLSKILNKNYEDIIKEVLLDSKWWENRIYEPDREKALEQDRGLIKKREIVRIYRVKLENGNVKWIKDRVKLYKMTNDTRDIIGYWEEFDKFKKIEIHNSLYKFCSTFINKIFENESIEEFEDNLYKFFCKDCCTIETIKSVLVVKREENRFIIKKACGIENIQEIENIINNEDKSLFNVALKKGYCIVPKIREQENNECLKKIYKSGGRSLFILNLYEGENNNYLVAFCSDHPYFFEKSIVIQLKDFIEIIDKKIRNLQLEKISQRVGKRGFLTDDANILAIFDYLSNIQKPFSLIMININDFANISLIWGFDFAKKTIKEVSHIIKASIKQEDVFFHFFIDSFIIITEEIQKDDIVSIIKRIQENLKKGIIVENQKIVLELIFNIVIYPVDVEDPLKTLDIANMISQKNVVYENNINFFDRSILREIDRNFYIKNLLYKALERNLFRFEYQPILCLKNSKKFNAEILIRLHDIDGTPISPEKFIDIAERIGIITDITKLVMQEAIVQMRKWIEKGVPIEKISINLSALDIENEEFFTWLEMQFLKNRVFPEFFSFEITERVALKNKDKALQFSKMIREIHSTLEIDDFGKGYSSLEMLNEFDFDIIKIDKDFVNKIDVDNKKRSLVNFIIKAAHDIGSKTVAEGVEAKEQLDILKKMGCDYVQGFYISRPLDAKDFEEFIRNFKGI